MKITFAGAADTVTGSRYVVQHEGNRLLDDCGLFQGFKTLRLRNWAKFPVSVDSIHAVILAHVPPESTCTSSAGAGLKKARRYSRSTPSNAVISR